MFYYGIHPEANSIVNKTLYVELFKFFSHSEILKLDSSD